MSVLICIFLILVIVYLTIPTKIVVAGMHVSLNDISGPVFGGDIVKTITFTDSCRYNLSHDEQIDWNKLFGQSFGFLPLKNLQLHYNSARFGWRYNPNSDMIEVSPYFYVKGERRYAETLGIEPASLEIGKDYRLTISPNKYTGEVTYSVVSLDRKSTPVAWCSSFRQDIPSTWGWSGRLYFGGNCRAPHSISVVIK